MPNAEATRKLVQDAIAEGATTVEEIHKSIADLPLKILEKSEPLRGPAKKIERVQDHTIGAIYDLIRDINEQVGKVASDLLVKASKSKTAGKKKPTHAAGRSR